MKVIVLLGQHVKARLAWRPDIYKAIVLKQLDKRGEPRYHCCIFTSVGGREAV